MCGSTYQTRKSYWWTQAVVRHSSLLSTFTKALSTTTGKRTFRTRWGLNCISAAPWHHTRQLVESPDRVIAVRCTQLGHFAEKCIICLKVAMCCQCAANVLPSDPRIVTVHLAMMEVLCPATPSDAKCIFCDCEPQYYVDLSIALTIVL